MDTPRRWSDLSDSQKGGFAALTALELVLTSLALTDLVRRPADQVRGPKAAWAAMCFVQPIGPVAYLVWGRHRS